MATALLDPLDKPVYGAKEFAEVLNLRDENGEPNSRKAFYLLEAKVLDATKIGTKKKAGWVSTPRRLLKSIGA